MCQRSQIPRESVDVVAADHHLQEICVVAGKGVFLGAESASRVVAGRLKP